MVVFTVDRHTALWDFSTNLLSFNLSLKAGLLFTSLMLIQMRSEQLKYLGWKIAARKYSQLTHGILLLNSAVSNFVHRFICWYLILGIQKLLSSMRYHISINILPISNYFQSKQIIWNLIFFRMQSCSPTKQKHFLFDNQISNELHWSWYYTEVLFQHRIINSTCSGSFCWKKVTVCWSLIIEGQQGMARHRCNHWLAK